MPEEIVINGKAVAVEDQKPDASSSGYIIIRTTGDPLKKAQKTELSELGVSIQEFVGQNGEQLYLCGFPHNSLEAIRGLSYIDYANIYSQEFVISQVLQNSSTSALASAYNSSDDTANELMEVDLLLHHDINEFPQELLGKISKIANVHHSAVTASDKNGASPEMVRIKVNAEALDRIAELDEIRVVHPVLERQLFDNIARRVMGYEELTARLNEGASKIEGPKDSSVKLWDGSGQIICVCDTGFDKGSTTDVHDAFAGRVKGLYSWGRSRTNAADDPDGHGTHVCGSVLGFGEHTSEGTFKGAAPGASLLVQSMFERFNYASQSVMGGYPKDLGLLFQQAYDNGSRIHSNSWGTPMLPPANVQRPYDTSAASIDRFVWNHQDMTILFAAGNEGQDTDLDGTVNERSLGSEASAKNCITIGACESYRPELKMTKSNAPYTYGTFWPSKYAKNPLKDDHLANNPDGVAAFSSRGPTAENRLKPDLVACGTAILSARSRSKKRETGIEKAIISDDARYMYLSGTSMATPLVAGCCAIVRQALLDQGYKDNQPPHNDALIDTVTEASPETHVDHAMHTKMPTASLIKALLINGAVPIRGEYMPENLPKEVHEGLPNPHSGFGRVNIANTLATITGSDSAGYTTLLIDEDTEQPSVTLLTVPMHVNTTGNEPIAGGLKTLKVTMACADLPGAALSNDLNLIVANETIERHGNQGPDKEFEKDSKDGFDRDDNVEQVVWPGLVGGTRLWVTVKPYRLMSTHVPFALVWRFT
ncbi:hypothetical protein VTL71DRAFT_12145 [Oculimacula yallundae]|uniref:Peptidase S8/S53 domain-containing protein n=1 Tax=Oculimacula yallundae TaxID=86028 RepID=A0ABR4CSP7_9HELO